MPLGCACLFALLAASVPRLVLIFIWLFTTRVSLVFQNVFIVPLLGIIFLPYTTLMYTLVWSPVYGVSGWAWFWVVIGLLLDISSYSGGAYSRRESRYKAAA